MLTMRYRTKLRTDVGWWPNWTLRAVGVTLAMSAALGGLSSHTAIAMQPEPSGTLSGPHRVDEWGKHIVPIPRCQSDRDSDCLVGLRVRTGGIWRDATLKGVRIEPIRADGFESGKSAHWTWEYESASEGRVGLTLWTVMYPRGVTYFGKDFLLHGLELELNRLAQPPFTNPLEGVTFDCSLGTVENCLLSPRLPVNDYFEVTVRTSWLRDNGVSIKGRDWKVEQSIVPGGIEWTLGAREALMSSPERWKDDVPAAGWEPVLGYILAHAGDGLHDSAFDPRCAAYGAPRQAGNTPGGGRLHWVKFKQTLDFEIHAPHLNPHGQPLTGDFTAEIPLEWLRCFAGKKLNPAYFTVSVLNEDGEDQVATTSLRVRKGTVYVRATGFHFSSPTIQLSTKKAQR